MADQHAIIIIRRSFTRMREAVAAAWRWLVG